MSRYLRKFAVFAFYLFGSGLSRLSEAFYTQFKNDYKGTLPAGNFRLYHKNENHLILFLIELDKFITIPEITQKIGKKLTATKDKLNKLKSRGLIERIGADKGGYWKVIEKSEQIYHKV